MSSTKSWIFTVMTSSSQRLKNLQQCQNSTLTDNWKTRRYSKHTSSAQQWNIRLCPHWQWHRVTGRAPGKNFQKCVKGSWSYITGCKLWPVPHFEHFFFSVSQTARGDGCHRRRQADRTDPDLGGTEGGGENMAELRFMICFNLSPSLPFLSPRPSSSWDSCSSFFSLSFFQLMKNGRRNITAWCSTTSRRWGADCESPTVFTWDWKSQGLFSFVFLFLFNFLTQGQCMSQ